jgi:hypothetical protein
LLRGFKVLTWSLLTDSEIKPLLQRTDARLDGGKGEGGKCRARLTAKKLANMFKERGRITKSSTFVTVISPSGEIRILSKPRGPYAHLSRVFNTNRTAIPVTS